MKWYPNFYNFLLLSPSLPKPVQVSVLSLFRTAALNVIWDLRCERLSVLADKLKFLYRNRSRIGWKSLLRNPSRVEGQMTKINTEPSVVFSFSCHFRKFLFITLITLLVELSGQIPTVRQAHWLLPNRVIFMWLEGLRTGFIPQEVTLG